MAPAERQFVSKYTQCWMHPARVRAALCPRQQPNAGATQIDLRTTTSIRLRFAWLRRLKMVACVPGAYNGVAVALVTFDAHMSRRQRTDMDVCCHQREALKTSNTLACPSRFAASNADSCGWSGAYCKS